MGAKSFMMLHLNFYFAVLFALLSQNTALKKVRHSLLMQSDSIILLSIDYGWIIKANRNFNQRISEELDI